MVVMCFSTHRMHAKKLAFADGLCWYEKECLTRAASGRAWLNAWDGESLEGSKIDNKRSLKKSGKRRYNNFRSRFSVKSLLFSFHKDLTCSEQGLAGTKLRRDPAPLYAANGNLRQVQRQGVQCIQWITWPIKGFWSSSLD